MTGTHLLQGLMKWLTRAEWRKSSRSGGNGGNCVEVARNLSRVVAVRDSKNPNGPALGFDTTSWTSFVGAIKEGGLSA